MRRESRVSGASYAHATSELRQTKGDVVSTMIRLGALVAVALAAAVVIPAGSGHAVGSWLYPPEVGLKLAAKGFTLPACSGRRAYRFTSRSNPNNQQTWQFRHFECFTYDNRGTVFICAHSLDAGRVAVTRVMLNNAYTPCRF